MRLILCRSCMILDGRVEVAGRPVGDEDRRPTNARAIGDALLPAESYRTVRLLAEASIRSRNRGTFTLMVILRASGR